MDGPDKASGLAANPNQLGNDQRLHKPTVPPLRSRLQPTGPQQARSGIVNHQLGPAWPVGDCRAAGHSPHVRQ